jgi:hypothetical protein
MTSILGRDDPGYAQDWPRGLRELAGNRHRVYGYHFDAPTFGEGFLSWDLYYSGDPDAFNAFVADYAKLPGDGFYEDQPLTLTLHDARKGVPQNFTGPDKDAPPFDWKLRITVNQVRSAMGLGLDPDVHVFLDVWVGEALPLDMLKFPQAVRLQAATLFDTFISKHEKQRMAGSVKALEMRAEELRRQLDETMTQLKAAR